MSEKALREIYARAQVQTVEQFIAGTPIADAHILSASAVQAELIAWESTTAGYTRYVTDSRYQKFSPEVCKWYKPYRCSECAAPTPASDKLPKPSPNPTPAAAHDERPAFLAYWCEDVPEYMREKWKGDVAACLDSGNATDKLQAAHDAWMARAAASPVSGAAGGDYEEVLAGHRRLVRELDVLLNGEEGAAKQASLCDIVAQVRRECIRSVRYPGAIITQAAKDMLAERVRQVSVEGWTPEHDDEHDPGELAAAGCAYAIAAADKLLPHSQGDGRYGPGHPPIMWQWDVKLWKPGEPRRMLEKAGALILAEMEKMDRAGGVE